ncbi:putative helicase-like protein [Leishmania major strain Friedlin]|uniref:Putative helicase-like protein n=1 Tax=Leishmania major TaxID=5664 RepID=Q4Q9N4_LEIMA|nr:putative helicase-like protein [Leishmania major strain Friedlin]CAG9575227.1 helicase-like_protein_-_putative [Leishmania major strain Friedlin]CAJ05517.1 putative helicase-like protein [Leishmania major strain Friedlin]|eukprot:XP_001683964.1 putative helicase-like protein [Leishmania major strain Friedlin]
MNLDNYFAKFLQKSSGRSAKGGESEKATLSSAAGAGVPVTPATATSSKQFSEGGGHKPSQGGGQSPGDAAEAQVQPSCGSPNAAFDQCYQRQQQWDADATEAMTVTALPESTHQRAPSLKRSREAAMTTSSSPAPSHSAMDAPAATRLLTCRAASEDDDDELALLLGSQKAKQVREADAMLEGVARAQQAPSPPLSSSSPGHASNGVVGTSSACAVGILAWQTSSSATRETIARYFQRQLEWELHHSADLFAAFEPFFKDRALDRIAANDALRPVLHAAPLSITSETVGALPGCALRSYQVEGVQFLLSHFHRGMSAILGDDMGLGKTAQVSAFLHTLKQLHNIDGPHLIVAPLSTLTSWTRELARWAPQLRVVKYHGERRTRAAISSGRHNRHAVFVTTPALLHLDKRFFRKRAWVTVVVDEAHVLKAHDTAITSASRKLTACYRVAVTGTPVHNNVQEVWSLMSFLYPWLMATYDPRARDPVRQAEECAKVLQYIMLRRTKADVELGIPPRVDEPLTKLVPTDIQLQLLSLLTAHALQESSTGHQLHGHLSHQRAVCNHPLALRLLADKGRTHGSQGSVEKRMRAAGVPMDAAHLIDPSAKMRYLDTLLPQLKEQGHRCLIFSNFTTTLDLLEAMCHLRGHSYERLDGSCNRVERELSILRYNHPASSCFLFLVTTTAGGVGVTLTGADTVILFDAHFNPQLDRQAADRAHRIGQARTVHVYRLCLQGTIEEHIRDIAARKAYLGDFIVEGGQRHGARGCGRSANDGADAPCITADDIREMLQQLDEKQHAKQQTDGSSVSSPTLLRPSDGAEGSTSSGSQAAADAMVKDLLRVVEKGLQGAAATAGIHGAGRGLASPPKQTHSCFCCGGIMHPMEPLLHCMVCPKAYHAACIGERPPRPGEAVKRFWSCPRHECFSCGKQQAADGAIFMCDACPRSFCFDCLDPRYLEMNASGAQLLHIRDTYAGMEEEEVEPRRSCYYVTCLRCCGLLSSSSSSASEDTDEVDSDEDDVSDCDMATAVDSDGLASVDGHGGAGVENGDN